MASEANHSKLEGTQSSTIGTRQLGAKASQNPPDVPADDQARLPRLDLSLSRQCNVLAIRGRDSDRINAILVGAGHTTTAWSSRGSGFCLPGPWRPSSRPCPLHESMRSHAPPEIRVLHGQLRSGHWETACLRHQPFDQSWQGERGHVQLWRVTACFQLCRRKTCTDFLDCVLAQTSVISGPAVC